MTNEEISKRITELCGAIVRLDARCNALEMVLSMVSENPGLPKEKVWAAVEAAYEQMHQDILVKIENKNPALAASLDFRVKPNPQLFG